MKLLDSNEKDTSLIETDQLQPTEDVNELIKGLRSPKKYISSRFFYDRRGSELFEQITALPEYYPYKTEKKLLLEHAAELLSDKKYTNIIELGSGDCSKVSILLDAINPQLISKYSYFPVDISDSALQKSASILSEQYKELIIKPIVADFMKHFDLLPGIDGSRLILFLGSTIGNLTREQSLDFLTKIRSRMHQGDLLLVGIDRVKDVRIIENAYNDSQGVTVYFNKNILQVANQHLQSNFDLTDFEHNAFFNTAELRIEMHLKAITDMQVNTPFSDQPIDLKKGETIHTENSHKFTQQQIMELAVQSGLHIEN